MFICSMSIYVIGHKSPDLDSVVAAISYANLKNKLTNSDDYIPATAGNINKVTEFVLDKYGFEKPEVLTDEKAQVVLVDHNEATQRFSESEEVKIVEILDHHKINFDYADPIEVTVKPWGATNSIIYKLYKDNNIEIDEKMAGLMLSAILDDTVITKSPTCTEVDKEIISELSKLAGVEDWQAYGLEMFKVKSSVSDFSAEEVVKMDYKDFEFGSDKFGIGQVETVDLSEFEAREEELLKAIEKIKADGAYHTVLLVITDIMKEGSNVLVFTDDQEKCEQALGVKIENNKTFVEGLVSRKKQVVPKFTEIFS